MNEKLKKARDLLHRFRSDTLHEKSPVGWHFTREELAYELDMRLGGLDLPDRDNLDLPYQGGTNNCGPAAFLYCLLKDRPDFYVQFATELWEHGEFDLGRETKRRLTVKPKHWTIHESKTIKNQAEAKASNSITKLDWMTMQSLFDKNHVRLTLPSALKSWFRAVGASACKDTFRNEAINYFVGQDVKDFYEVLEWLSYTKHPLVYWIVMEINPEMIVGQDFSLWSRHWVVVNKSTSSSTPHNPQPKTSSSFVHAHGRREVKGCR